MEHSVKFGNSSRTGVFSELIAENKGRVSIKIHNFSLKVSEKWPESPKKSITSTYNEQIHMSSLKLLLSFVPTQRFPKKAVPQWLGSIFFSFRGRPIQCTIRKFSFYSFFKPYIFFSSRGEFTP